MRINSQVIIDETDLSTESTSETIELDHIYGYSIYVLFTGSETNMETEGFLDTSNDGVSWNESITFTLAGLGDTCVINSTDVFYKMARVRLKSLSGTISPKITVYKKGS